MLFLWYNLHMKLQEIQEELVLVLKGKTLSALLPSFVFVVANNLVDILYAVIISGATSLYFIWQGRRKNLSLWYSVGGFMVVLVAAGLSILQGAAGFFIPSILTSGGLFLASVLSIPLKKPLTAYVSHLTRGWPLPWFWRADVRPAYSETTMLWAGFFGLRLALQIWTYNLGADEVFIVNLLLGVPGLILLLTATYAYGIWRLHQLKGPGVDEFIQEKKPPYRGQTRGF